MPGVDLQLPFKKYLSEDWSFCQRWKAIGGKIYADTSIVLRHIGKIPYSLYNVHVSTGENPIQKADTPPAGFDLESK